MICDYFSSVCFIFLVLAAVGRNKYKRLAYEAGLMRSDLSNDSYHELLCKESAITCQGKFSWAGNFY